MTDPLEPDRDRRLEDLSEPQPADLADLMPTPFMQAHTEFDTIAEMFAAAGHADIEGSDLPRVLQSSSWNEFVAEHSRFGGWEQMRQHAEADRARARRGSPGGAPQATSEE